LETPMSKLAAHAKASKNDNKVDMVIVEENLEDSMLAKSMLRDVTRSSEFNRAGLKRITTIDADGLMDDGTAEAFEVYVERPPTPTIERAEAGPSASDLICTGSEYDIYVC